MVEKKGYFGDTVQKQQVIDNNYRNFFCFGIMKTMPLFLQTTVYNGGQYNQISSDLPEEVYSTQTQSSMSTSSGLYASFMESYNVLDSMPHMTNISDNESGAFLFLSSDLTHEPMLLQTPDYTPSQNVDNTEYDAANTDRFAVDGNELRMKNANQMIHYHANMATFIQLGEWFDYLRENGLYDNTRIILVSDHGQNLAHQDELIMDDGTNGLKNVELYYPLLMVKDYNSEGFTTSNEFMTNADVPTLATKDIIENPKNPFTGKPINSDEKTAHDQFVILSLDWDVSKNNGNTFFASKWASVRDSLWEKDNWTFYDETVVLKEHEAP